MTSGRGSKWDPRHDQDLDDELFGLDTSDLENRNAAVIQGILGLEYDLTDPFVLTSDARVNGIQSEGVSGFYFSWQILGLRYRFGSR